MSWPVRGPNTPDMLSPPPHASTEALPLGRSTAAILEVTAKRPNRGEGETPIAPACCHSRDADHDQYRPIVVQRLYREAKLHIGYHAAADRSSPNIANLQHHDCCQISTTGDRSSPIFSEKQRPYGAASPKATTERGRESSLHSRV